MLGITETRTSTELMCVWEKLKAWDYGMEAIYCIIDRKKKIKQHMINAQFLTHLLESTLHWIQWTYLWVLHCTIIVNGSISAQRDNVEIAGCSCLPSVVFLFSMFHSLLAIWTPYMSMYNILWIYTQTHHPCALHLAWLHADKNLENN